MYNSCNSFTKTLMTQYQLEIYLENLFPQITFINESQWQSWLITWFNNLDLDLDCNKTYEINLRLTDDQEIQVLNKQFRDQDKPTDVLSFAALEDDFPDIEDMDAIALMGWLFSVYFFLVNQV